MSEPLPFLRPRLVGERFQGGAIPLEVLRDFAVMEEMIVEVAKWIYLQAHPDRKRSPRGFTDGISLKITGIDDGSAIPLIGLFLSTAAIAPQQNQVYFEEARDRIINAVDAAENNRPITFYLPENLLGYFDRVGRSLRDGEFIELNPTSPDSPGRLNKITRRKLVLASGHVQELTEAVVLRGAVPEADQEKMTFTLQVISGPRVSAAVGSQHIQTIIDAFNGYRTGARIILQGVGRYSRYNNRLQSIETVEHISLLEPNDVAARLDEFRSLKVGWFEGKGFALAPEGLDWLSRAFEENYPEQLPLPYLYPTAEGGVQAEWSLHPYELSLEISLDSHHAEWHALNLEDDQEITKQLDLDAREDWEWMSTRIEELGGSKAQ